MLNAILGERAPFAAGRYGRWSDYLCFALLLYMASYFAGVSSHFSNNLFYVLAGVPTLAFCVVRRADALGALRRFWPVLLMFALAVVSELFAPEGDPLGVARSAAYLVVLALALHVAAANPRLMAAAFAMLGLSAAAFGAVAIAAWSLELASNASYVRVELAELNVTRASLLALFGVLALWLLLLEPILAARRAAFVRGAAFAVVTAFCVMLALAFQSRSSIVALMLFLCAYGLFERRFRLVAGVGLAAAALLLLTGLYEVLLLRGGSYRGEIWGDALRRLLDECSLLTGCGSAGGYLFYGRFQNPHSGYLATLYYHGMGTLAALLLVIGRAAYCGWKHKDRFALLLVIGLGGAIASSPGFIDAPEPQWVYFWIPLMLVLDGQRRSLPAADAAGRMENDDR